MCMDRKMNDAWEFIWEKLFCEKTNLFYDYLTSHVHEQRLEHLPLVEEVQAQVPNPCGWGTGMEDSMLNSGSIADIIRLRKELCGDENSLDLAEKLLDGMWRCTHVHGKPGFVARSISPRDGKSCYYNSSRDQFTLCVYGAWRLWHTFPQEDSLREKAAQLLVDIAKYCEEVVTPESDYNLMRLDGKPALVSKMVNTYTHEIMRLPMFYAAAWDVTKDEHWFELYRKYALPAIEENLNLDPNHPWWDIELSQMQVSLSLVAAVEPEDNLREKYNTAVRLTAELTEKYFRNELQKAKEFTGDWDHLNDVWRNMPFRVRNEILKTPHDSSMFGGYAYFLPKCSPEYHTPWSLLRACGNLLYTLGLCPDYALPKDLAEAFTEIAAKPDYPNHGSDAPINLLHGYWLAKKRGWIS